jgi:lambda family phage portal protein
MNFLERTIATLSPSWGSERAKKRNLLAAYEAANPTRTHRGEQENRSGNQAVFASGKSLRDQARWLDENHDLAIGMLDKLEERIVGAKGIMVDPQPKSLTGEVNKEFAEEIRKRWATWSIKPDVTGRFTRQQVERLAVRSWLRDGEVFAQFVRGNVPNFKHLNESKFSIEMLEADFVPLQLNVPKERTKQGIVLNTWGRPIAYHVLYDHPGDTTGIRVKTKKIESANMLHLAMVKRLHQLRGVSVFHGVIVRLADLKQYEESERVAARIAAALGFYIKKGTADMYAPEAASDKPREIPFSPGMTFDELQVGEEIGMVESNRPNTHLEAFRNGQLKAISAGTRGSYSSIARDYDGSYSSQRQELVESFEGYAVMQDEFVAQWSRPVYREWLKMELLNMDVPPDIDQKTLFNAVYLAPVMPWIDPKKEAESWKTQIRGGAASETEWINARGKNPSEVKAQRLSEIEFNKANGLITDTDPANDMGLNNAKTQQNTNEPTSQSTKK